MHSTIAHDQTHSKSCINVSLIQVFPQPAKQTTVEITESCKSPITFRTDHHVACGSKSCSVEGIRVDGLQQCEEAATERELIAYEKKAVTEKFHSFPG